MKMIKKLLILSLVLFLCSCTDENDYRQYCQQKYGPNVIITEINTKHNNLVVCKLPYNSGPVAVETCIVDGDFDCSQASNAQQHAIENANAMSAAALATSSMRGGRNAFGGEDD